MTIDCVWLHDKSNMESDGSWDNGGNYNQLVSCVGVVLSGGTIVLAGVNECSEPQSTKCDVLEMASELWDK